MRKKIVKYGLSGALFFPAVAFAATINTACGLIGLIFKFAQYFYQTLLVVSVIMIIWAGYLYVIGGDDTEKVTNARKTLTYAAVGIAVAILAWTMPNIISDLVGSTGNSGNNCGSTASSSPAPTTPPSGGGSVQV